MFRTGKGKHQMVFRTVLRVGDDDAAVLAPQCGVPFGYGPRASVCGMKAFFQPMQISAEGSSSSKKTVLGKFGTSLSLPAPSPPPPSTGSTSTRPRRRKGSKSKRRRRTPTALLWTWREAGSWQRRARGAICGRMYPSDRPRSTSNKTERRRRRQSFSEKIIGSEGVKNLTS